MCLMEVQMMVFDFIIYFVHVYSTQLRDTVSHVISVLCSTQVCDRSQTCKIQVNMIVVVRTLLNIDFSHIFVKLYMERTPSQEQQRLTNLPTLYSHQFFLGFQINYTAQITGFLKSKFPVRLTMFNQSYLFFNNLLKM